MPEHQHPHAVGGRRASNGLFGEWSSPVPALIEDFQGFIKCADRLAKQISAAALVPFVPGKITRS
jgi:hypothetical protein